MKKTRDEIVDCQKCSLSETRNLPVVGEGSHEAKIMFIGEAPGANEDRTGRPFCGRAGKVLDELLESAGIEREDVYIANILKCRPPNNRDPLKSEIEACTPYLEEQIKIINPKVLCPLGRYAMYYLMERYGLETESISKAHGQRFETDDLTIIPLYHPAVAIYNRNMKPELEKDFQTLKGYC